VFVDTAGIDDESELGGRRIAKTNQIISQIDIALLLFTNNQFGVFERSLLEKFKKRSVPVVIIHNQSDIIPMDQDTKKVIEEEFGIIPMEFSCSLLDDHDQKELVSTLTARIVDLFRVLSGEKKCLFDDLAGKDDVVVLVCPIDSEAPEGRLILPQVNAIRDLLDRDAVAVVLQTDQLKGYLDRNAESVKLVVTDSQAFAEIDKIVPKWLPLTGFSVLLARLKGAFDKYLEGTPVIDKLEENDRILILESCSHHSSCDDIGRVKIPSLLNKRTGSKIKWDIVAGLDPLPEDLDSYKLVIQCGGCMITDKQLSARLDEVIDHGIPVTNYGMTIAWCLGIYDRAVGVFVK
jgi:[FeFe] hydrogenase H-cluster maturation GTPase HydF